MYQLACYYPNVPPEQRRDAPMLLVISDLDSAYTERCVGPPLDGFRVWVGCIVQRLYFKACMEIKRKAGEGKKVSHLGWLKRGSSCDYLITIDTYAVCLISCWRDSNSSSISPSSTRVYDISERCRLWKGARWFWVYFGAASDSFLVLEAASEINECIDDELDTKRVHMPCARQYAAGGNDTRSPRG